MKFVALGVLLLAFIFSWRGTQNPSDIPAAIHFSLQSELQQFIQKYISENVASAKEIKFHRLWTKPVDIDTVDAQFEYSFLSQADGEGLAKTLLSGTARLNRVQGAEAASEGWSLARVQIDDQTIEFEQGMLIRSDGSSAPPAPSEIDASQTPKAPGDSKGTDHHEETHH